MRFGDIDSDRSLVFGELARIYEFGRFSINSRESMQIIEDIANHPRTGLGHPEPLVGGSDITYSRHITARDRIIYDIYDDVIAVLIIQAEEHYDDK